MCTNNNIQGAKLKGLLPNKKWLLENGFRGLVKAMEEHPDKFKHIPQTKDCVNSDEK
jgi:hypothetical protein